MDAGGLIHVNSPPPPANSAGGGGGMLSVREKLHRHIKLLPANALHTWKMTSMPFRLLFLVTTAISVLLVLSEMKVRDLSRLNLRADTTASATGRRLTSCTSNSPCHILMVADPDTRSLVGSTGGKPRYMSKLLYGRLHFDNPSSPVFRWGSDLKPHDVVGKLAEEGRGMELSELVLWSNQLLSFDDRTGVVYELVVEDAADNTTYSLPNYFRAKGNYMLPAGKQVESVPRYIISEEQDSAKGMKIEWACEKNRALYIGSFGKEYTTRDGSQISGESNFWVVRINENGSDIERVNWKSQYGRLREITGTTYPGYLIHEAVNWSDIRQKWYFLPRRESKEQYNERADELRGTNLIIEIDEHFDKYKLTRVKFDEDKPHPARGFSSFKFIPGTGDSQILAIRSEEDDQAGILKTHVSVINVDTGDLIYPETQVSDEYKFEGIELW